MEECLPKKAKVKKSSPSSDPRVVAARDAAKAAHDKYDTTNTEEDKGEWKEALNNLYQAYDLVKEEQLT